MYREKFTIVHTHTPKPGLLGQLAARLARVPIVINTLHGFYFHDHMPAAWRRFYVATETIAASCSDVVLSQNKEDIKTAIDERICRPNKIELLGNGINLQEFDRAQINYQKLERVRRELRIPHDSPVIGFVGRLVREKGVLELLEAARTVLQHDPNVRFLFVGPIDHEKQDAVKPQNTAADIAHACIFTGLWPVESMPTIYALMDIFVLPSHREGFPRAAMEASAMGVPNIVTDIRGCREAVTDGQNGILVLPGDVPALANAILKLLENQELAKGMGQKGRQRALQEFDERLVFAKVRATYARLLVEKGFVGPTAFKYPAVDRPF